MTHDEMIRVIEHHKNGGEVEYRYKSKGVEPWTNAEEPLWDFDRYDYRIKEKPKTKTVYEWMHRYETLNAWEIEKDLFTEEEAKNYLSTFIYQKTGRQWEVPND